MMVPGQGMVGVPAGRASADEVGRLHGQIAGDPLVANLLDAVPEILLILNEQRQVVFANKALLRLFGAPCQSAVLGRRPGELFDCAHAEDEPGGCGTSEFCGTCGAVAAIVSSLRGWEEVQECRLTQRNGNALDLRVWATPMVFDGRRYSLFSVKDISHEKRRHTLERIFFHDILNTAGGVQMVADVLVNASPAEMDEFKALIQRLSENLIDEITSQQQIVAGENNELSVNPSVVSARSMLERVAEQYRNHEVAKGRTVTVAGDACETEVFTDQALARRVLGNMLKNALEASRPGETVMLDCVEHGEEVEFRVHNDADMPRDVQLQMFQRSFSTKGRGRGLGTYSMKLLGERYLKGQVWFETGEGRGTTFKFVLPLRYVTPPDIG